MVAASGRQQLLICAGHNIDTYGDCGGQVHCIVTTEPFLLGELTGPGHKRRADRHDVELLPKLGELPLCCGVCPGAEPLRSRSRCEGGSSLDPADLGTHHVIGGHPHSLGHVGTDLV